MVNIIVIGDFEMRVRILISYLFMITMYFIANEVQCMEKIKEEALDSSGVNLYKLEHDLKEYVETVADSVVALKKLSQTITGNPNNYKMFLNSMDVPNVLNAMQSHLFNIFDAYGLTNDLVEKHVQSEKEKAVKKACKPKDQLLDDLKTIMLFNIEDADLHLSHQKLKLLKINLEG
jgi:hypothetical protein